MTAATLFVDRKEPKATVADMADHIDHIRRVAGIDYIGLGVNYASRIGAAAEPSEILVSDATLDGVNGVFLQGPPDFGAGVGASRIRCR